MDYRPYRIGKEWMKHPLIRQVVAGTFPNYRLHRVYVKADVEQALYGLNWDGGSRNEYRFYNTVSRQGKAIGDHMSHPANNRDEGRKVPIQPGEVIVQGGTFCGKQSSLYITVHPDDRAKYPQGEGI